MFEKLREALRLHRDARKTAERCEGLQDEVRRLCALCDLYREQLGEQQAIIDADEARISHVEAKNLRQAEVIEASDERIEQLVDLNIQLNNALAQVRLFGESDPPKVEQGVTVPTQTDIWVAEQRAKARWN